MAHCNMHFQSTFITFYITHVETTRDRCINKVLYKYSDKNRAEPEPRGVKAKKGLMLYKVEKKVHGGII